MSGTMPPVSIKPDSDRAVETKPTIVRAGVRYVLGTLQMCGAATGFALLVLTGLSRATITVTVLTTTVTLISRAAFPRRR